MQRFDLIYLILDKPNEASDRKLARHLLSLYNPNRPPAATPISQRSLMEYISFARQECHPVITDEVRPAPRSRPACVQGGRRAIVSRGPG